VARDVDHFAGWGVDARRDLSDAALPHQDIGDIIMCPRGTTAEQQSRLGGALPRSSRGGRLPLRFVQDITVPNPTPAASGEAQIYDGVETSEMNAPSVTGSSAAR
jgi:hypothetical protein